MKADYEAYYRDALRFLGCVDIKLLSGETLYSRCQPVCISRYVHAPLICGSHTDTRADELAVLSVTAGEEQMERAFSLSLAALMGENVYNFGELVSLETSLPWLVKVRVILVLSGAVHKLLNDTAYISRGIRT